MFRQLCTSYGRLGLRSLATSAAKSGVETTDILIVGGGPAGLTLAAAIKNSPVLNSYKTTLVDAGDLGKIRSFYDSPPKDFTNRVVSLTPPSVNFIENRAGAPLMRDRMMLYDGMYVTDGCSDGTLDLEKDSIAYMVEILNVQASLLKRLDDMKLSNSSFDMIDKTKVTKIERSDPANVNSWPVVTLDNGKQFKTRLLVGADGFNSPVRAFSGIESRGWFYNKFGVVATMKLKYPPFKVRGWQRFLPNGPIAHLPLPDDNATLVWSTTEEISKLLVALSPEEFTAMVNAGFVLENADMNFYYDIIRQKKWTPEQLITDINERIAKTFQALPDENEVDERYPPPVESILGTSRARFPMKMFHADKYCSERSALLGDAAHTTHPLAGQGLNMGQGDTEALINALETATKRGLDIGSLLALEPFWSDRYWTNAVLVGIADKCHKLYSTDFPPVVAARTLGAKVINNIDPIRNLITNTLGSSGR